MNTNVKTNFWGNGMTLQPLGPAHCMLTRHKEIYTIHRPATTVRNLMIGTMFIEHTGTMIAKRTCIGGPKNDGV
jgi:hypothetical protein